MERSAQWKQTKTFADPPKETAHRTDLKVGKKKSETYKIVCATRSRSPTLCGGKI